jgi:putative lipoprotein
LLRSSKTAFQHFIPAGLENRSPALVSPQPHGGTIVYNMKKRHVWLTLWICALVLLAACSGTSAQQHQTIERVQRHGAVAPQTYVYACSDNYSFVARIEGEKAWLFLPKKTLRLPHVPAASGAKYTDGQITFWSKGDEALIEDGQETHRKCKNNRAKAIWEHAKLGGVDFRAVGNEPGWYLELRKGDSVVFVVDYGQRRFEFTTPAPMIDQQARVTTYRVRANEHELVIVIIGQHCRDSMSGEPFETSVTVVLDDREYQGCGRPLH